jgi:hypothetical protein
VTGRRAGLALNGLALAALLAAALGACGGDGGGSGACGPVRREPLDSRSVHVLPGADEPDYRTDPPTSGPHLPSPSTEDVREDPIAPPVQVGLLEEGAVLIQHTGLADADRAEVEALAGDGVIVAPADDLPDDAAVVATAWVTKLVCEGVDTSALEAFAGDHVDQGPGQHG